MSRKLFPQWRREYWFILLVSAYLLSPLGLHTFITLENINLQALVVTLFSLTVGVLWIALLHCLVRRTLWLYLLLLPFFAFVGIDLFLVLAFGTRLSSSYLLIMFTESSEAGEFLTSYMTYILVAGAIFLLVWLVSVAGVRNLVLRPPRRLTLALAALLLSSYGLAFARFMVTNAEISPGLALRYALDRDLASPMGLATQGVIARQQYLSSNGLVKQRKAHRFDARRADGEETLIVLVIGESARPDHWSLHGYGRQTNPRLEQLDGLVWFPDVTTAATITRESVPAILSLAPVEKYERVLSESSVLAAFREAGVPSWWLSTQAVNRWGGPNHIVAGEASHQRYFEYQLDSVLIKALEQLLKTEVGSSGLVVLHGRGSHFYFRNRYTRSDAHWPDDESQLPPREFLVNSYDNSIRYTDGILADAIDLLADTGRPAVLLYVSDHGENLLDDERELFGHGLATEHDLRTAQLFWASDSWRQQHPERWQAIRANAGQPIHTSSIAHSLLDIAGIRARGAEAHKSWVQSDFEPQVPRPYWLDGQLLYFGEKTMLADAKDGAAGNGPQAASAEEDRRQRPPSE